MEHTPIRVYIAGPLFTPEQRGLLERIDRVCEELGLSTFIPHRDIGVYGQGDSRKFFEGDMQPLCQCSMVIAVLDWRGIGSGTAWEIGYAYAKGVPVIGLVDDIGSLNRKERMCVMCYNSVKLVDCFDKLKKEIKKLLV